MWISKKKYQGLEKRIAEVLKPLSKEELCDVWNNLNNFKWDDRLGEKPRNYDNLPNYNLCIWQNLYRKTKYKVTEPYFKCISKMVSEHDLLYYANVICDKTMTKKEFHRWWLQKVKEY